MAKSRTQIIRVPTRSPAPVIRVSAPRAAPIKRRRSRGRSRSSGGGLGIVDIATAAFVLKMAVEQLGPRLPVFIAEAGPMGSIAMLANFIHANKWFKGVEQVSVAVAVYTYLTSQHPAGGAIPGSFHA